MDNMEMKEIQLNRLAFQLSERLNRETREFLREYHTADGRCIVGAANLYLAGLFVNFPDKQTALKALDENFEKIREILNRTPDVSFVAAKTHIGIN